ncbi:hypothetical protein [Spirosoma validum]|uniref:Uncharacterized protein n=1 Tax=Spirosoma validum TaxID=2771355 RepID=A0A927B4E5_9BACT|nr:hypothetical protein [Spirosoma validum]MBD2755434.1 hypothetical protein [Spirosoma validum]
MAQQRSNYLVDQLLSNKLSRAEFDEFLAGLHNPDDLQIYSDALETYFNELVNDPDPPPDSDEKTEPFLNEAKTRL